MHRNSNITGNPISTFHNAGSLNFWRLEDVDNQRCYSYKNTFTFTGKAPREGNRTPMNKIKYSEERDEETGYGYFGARYMDHELMTGWLSVDPMADKYPGISPYAYCTWNTVRLVDPDGRDTFNIDLKTGNIISSKIELLGKHCFNFYNDDRLVGSCGDLDGMIIHDRVSWDGENGSKNFTDYFSFSDGNTGKKIFNTISSLAKDVGSRSSVEWDYYMLADGSGDLSTSHLSNLIGHGCDKYNPGKVTSWDHYHPNNSNKSWYPSISDQRNARNLQNKSYGSIPCTLHTCGESYRFDTLVYNRDYYPSEMTRFVPSRVLNSTW